MEHRRQEEYQKLQNIPLTDDCIKSDLLSEIRRVQREQIEQWIFFCIGFLLLAWVPNLLRDLAIPDAVMIGGAVGSALVLIYRLYGLCKERAAIEHREYLVTVQTLVNVGREKRTWRDPENHRPINRREIRRSANALYFQSQHWIYPQDCYQWCDQFRALSEDEYRRDRMTFVIGDAFYVILLPRTGRIVYAYNTNYFSYNGVITE